MPTHAEQKILPYTPQQMYDLVADVGVYPDFLPWCLAARIREQSQTHMLADLVIGYKIFKEKFTSYVKFDPDNKTIHVEYLSGPLSRLNNHWTFSKTEDGQCLVDFWLDFDFHSKTLQAMMDFFFNEAVKRMVSAFEERAQQIYSSGQ